MKQGEINGHLENLIDQVDSLDSKMDDVRERVIKVEGHLVTQNGSIARHEKEIGSLKEEVMRNLKFRYIVFGALLLGNIGLSIFLVLLKNGGV